jgi:nucleotide-binding universal stress UspA family protein
MFNKILCPTDGSDHSLKALDLAIDMAKKYDADLIVLHIPERSGNIDALQRFAEIEGITEHFNQEKERLRSMDYAIGLAEDSAFRHTEISPRLLIEVGQRIIDGAKSRAADKGLDNIDTRLEGGDPASRILECVDKDGVDCVIMGSRGLSDLKGMFLGSVSHKVANHAPCTCITVK